MNNESYSTMDAYLAAFLTIKNCHPTYRFSNNKIVFSFELTPDLQRNIELFESGELVNVYAFTKAIKQVKSIIFSMKDERRYGQMGNR